jgi:hypothetical protein
LIPGWNNNPLEQVKQFPSLFSQLAQEESHFKHLLSELAKYPVLQLLTQDPSYKKNPFLHLVHEHSLASFMKKI